MLDCWCLCDWPEALDVPLVAGTPDQAVEHHDSHADTTYPDATTAGCWRASWRIVGPLPALPATGTPSPTALP